MLISVILTSCDRGRMLAQSVNSCLRQSEFMNPSLFEVIIVDDNSRDPLTLSILDSLKEFKNFVIVRNSTRTGNLAVNKNIGIRHSKGEYITFLDDDNMMAPDKLPKMYKALATSNKKFGYHNCGTLEGNTCSASVSIPKPPSFDLESLKHQNYIDTGDVMIHRSIFESIGLFDESLGACEDWDLFLRISYKFESLFYPDVLSYYRKHSGQLIKVRGGRETSEAKNRIREKCL